jgi:hypothetical protein
MRKGFLLALALLLASFVAIGQTGTGDISGRVLDPSGSVVPNVKVTAVNVATNETSKTVANATGEYRLFSMKPGMYRLIADVAGFKHLERSGIELRVADRLTVDLSLQVGQTTETVVVTAEAPLLRTQDAQTGDIIDNNAIMELPVIDHEPLDLLRLSSNFQGSGNKGDAENRINGGRPLGLEYFVDGIAVATGIGHGVAQNTPTMQGVEEFKVLTNGVSAEFGRMSGGAVQLVTKSGTNEWHGQLFEYDQNRVFNANAWGQNMLGNSKPLFQYNLFGGAVGGPLVLPKIYDGHNKTFFYFDYQETKNNHAGTAQTASVPTQAMRNGDFSGVQVNGTQAMIYDRFSPVVCGDTNVPYTAACTDTPNRSQLLNDGVHIPAAQMDPVALAIQKLIVAPNRTADANCTFCNDFIGYQNSSGDDKRYAGRIDQVLTANQRIFGRFTWNDRTDINGSRWEGPLQAPSTNIVKGASSMTLDYVNTLSPSTILDARVGYYFSPNQGGALWDPAAVKSLQAVLPPILDHLMGPTAIPWTSVPDMSDVIGNGYDGVTNSTSYQGNVSLTKVLAKHTLKFGYEYRRYYDNFSNSGGAWMINDGDSAQRQATDNLWGDAPFSVGYASFLEGSLDHISATGYTTRALNYNYHASFVQDDFKVNSKLTLNLGLRWEMETPLTERNNKLFFWDPKAPSQFSIASGYNFGAALTTAGLSPSAIATPSWVANGLPKGAIVAAATPEHSDRYGPGYHPLQLAPRFGAAYQLDSKTVIRGSLGMMYLSTSGNSGAMSSAGQGFALADSIPEIWHSNQSIITNPLTWSNPVNNTLFPGEVLAFTRNTQQANLQMTGGGSVPVVYSLNSHAPRELNWNLTIQRQVGNSLLLEVQYNGNKGIGLLLPNQTTSQFPQSLYTGGLTQANLYNTTVASPFAGVGKWGPTETLNFLEYPYPQYGPVGLLGTNDGRSLYDAVVFRAEKRMSHGISFLASYTWSRMMDNTGGPNVGSDITNSGGTGGRNPQSVTNWASDYGVSPLDQTHRIIASFTAQLPIGKGRALLSTPQGWGGKVLDGIVGGWQFAGIFSGSTGRPIVINFSNGQAANGFGRIINTWGSYNSSNHDIGVSSFSGANSVFYNTAADTTQIPNRRFCWDNVKQAPSCFSDAQPFVLGNMDPVYPGIRQPGLFNTDLSLMKSFNLGAEGKRYLQVRMEASNAFNQRGFPNYQTTTGQSNFGLAIGDPNNPWRQPRIMQMSGRIVF